MTGLQSMMLELGVLGVMILTVIALALYRHSIAKQQDFHIHVSANEAQGVNEQATVDHRLTAIDKWGKILTALTVVYFLVLAGVLMYQEWTRSGSLG